MHSNGSSHREAAPPRRPAQDTRMAHISDLIGTDIEAYLHQHEHKS